MDYLYVHDWEDYHGENKSLKLGEPYIFSYAAYFDIPDNDHYTCEKIKFRIEDHLGHISERIVDTEFKPYHRRFILCMKLLSQCEAEANNSLTELRSREKNSP